MNTFLEKTAASLLLVLTSLSVLAINVSIVSAVPTVGTNVRVTNLSYNQNEPSLAVNLADTRKFVVGYNDYSSGSTWRLGWSWSDDQGSSWTRGGMFTVSGYSCGGNPIVAFDNSGNCYYAGMVYNLYATPTGTWSQDGSIFLAKSSDGGHTFSVFQKLIATGSGINPSLDRPWMYINPVSNHIYLTWVKRDNAWASDGTQRMTIWFTRSTNGGVTFSTPIQIGSDLDVSTYPCSHGPQVAVGPGSTVYVSWHTTEEGTLGTASWKPPRIWISQSANDGVTFSESYLVAVKQNSYPAMFISMETDASSGIIYIAYCERPTYPGDMDVYVATAPAATGPWISRRVNDDPVGNGAGQWYPVLDVAPNGRVDVVWYDFRAGSNTRDVYYSASRNQGSTWETNTKVTDATSASSDYAGDYVGSVVSQNNKATVVWGDGRYGSNTNQEIYSAVLTMTSSDRLTIYDRSIKSAWATSTPTINGAIAAGEWDDATEIKPIWQSSVGYTYPAGVYARFKNDANYLYVLYEVDIVPYYSTAALMTFDSNHDHAYTAGKEHDFLVAKLFETTGEVTTVHRVSVDSSGTFEIDCSPFSTTRINHAGLAVGIAAGSSSRDSRAHPIIEWRIPLALLGVTVGKTIGFAMSGPSRDGIVYGEYLDVQWPEYRSVSGPRPISGYGDLILASPPKYLVVRGLGNSIYYRTYSSVTGYWSSWVLLPGTTLDSPAATIHQNKLHIVARGVNGDALWHGYVDLSTNVFSGWTLLGGTTPSAPTLTSNGTTLCLVVRGQDNRIYYRYYTGSWGIWYVVPNGATCDGPAAAMISNNLYIVVRSMDQSSLWRIVLSSSGGVLRNWALVSGSTASKPVLADSSLDKTCLVVRGVAPLNSIYYRQWVPSTDSWGSWVLLPGAMIDGAGAAVIANGLHITVRGTSQNVIWNGYVDLTSGTFLGWTLLSGSTPSAPTLTS